MIIFSYKLYVFFLIISTFYQNSRAEFSLDTIKNWFLGNQEEIVYKEEPFNKNGTLTLANDNGTITVKTWSSPKIAAEIIKIGSEKERDSVTITTALDKNNAQIKTINSHKHPKVLVHYNLIVPEQASLNITSKKGIIKIKNAQGPITAIAHQGSITITNAAQSIHAHASDTINLSCLHISLNNSITLKTISGPIVLTMPVDTNAYVHAKTEYGTVTSDHFISLKPITSKLNHHAWTRFKREVQGTIGNGGASINLTSEYGAIKLLE